MMLLHIFHLFAGMCLALSIWFLILVLLTKAKLHIAEKNDPYFNTTNIHSGVAFKNDGTRGVERTYQKSISWYSRNI